MSEFLAYSKEIVSDFLQTAVFLDDRATYGDEQPTQIPANINNPITWESEPTTTNSDGMRTPTDASHILDAKAIIDTFTEKGIVCSVIKCTEEEYERKKSDYIKLMKKADIIVLDWDLFRDDGEYVMTIIDELISSDTTLKELRSIVIYTANGLPSIIEKLNAICVNFEFGKYLSNNNPYTTISLFNKPGLSSIEDRKVDFNELVDRCIDEFTETFHGIIPNVAMASIAEVRKNTHKLLGVLNKDLDPAYLSHRALLGKHEKSDAEKHLEEIIISELESIIHENKVGSKANIDVLKKSPIVVTSEQLNGKSLGVYLTSREIDRNDIKAKECLTKEWSTLDATKSFATEKEFAILTLLQTEYSSNEKHLTLGVIIKHIGNSKYYLCIQPRCDSVRLTRDNEFSFLELEKASQSEFDFLFPNDEEKYKLNYNKKHRKTILFTASLNKTVDSIDGVFKDSHDYAYKYVASLKKSQAQRVANEYAAYISRVGLNESEYLRRNRPK